MERGGTAKEQGTARWGRFRLDVPAAGGERSAKGSPFSRAANALFICAGDSHDMETRTGTCEHRWRYFVNVQARAVRVRECERCGKRAVIPTQLEPLPRPRPERLSA